MKGTASAAENGNSALTYSPIIHSCISGAHYHWKQLSLEREKREDCILYTRELVGPLNGVSNGKASIPGVDPFDNEAQYNDRDMEVCPSTGTFPYS